MLIKSTLSAGGPSNIGRISKERFNFINLDPNPTIRHTLWTLVLGSVPQYFYLSITQAGVQRILSTPNIKVARRLLYFAAPIYCIVWVMTMFEGVTVFAYFHSKGCDPLASGQIKNPNQIIPFTILEMFHDLHGMPGLFIAALSAASLSTISSGLSGLSAVMCVDFLKVYKPRIKDGTALSISKLFVVMFGLISASLAFLLSNIDGPLIEINGRVFGSRCRTRNGNVSRIGIFPEKSAEGGFLCDMFRSSIKSVAAIWSDIFQGFGTGTVSATRTYCTVPREWKCDLHARFPHIQS